MTIVPQSCSVGDPDYDWDLGSRLIVALDGTVQTSVIAYDIPAGTVTRHVLNDKGHAQVDPNNEGEVWMETVSGVVEVTLAPHAEADKRDLHRDVVEGEPIDGWRQLSPCPPPGAKV